ncbi:uncharacterized protein LOC144192261 [Stigmatopora nigra]
MKKFLVKISNKIRKQNGETVPRSCSAQIQGFKEKTMNMDILHKAASQGEMCKMQLSSLCGDVNKPDKNNRTALHLACTNGHAEVVHFLIGKKANINLCDNQNRTALMMAVQYQNDVIVSILLENDADVDLVDVDGNTALHLASKIPSMDSVILLVKKDANINAKNLKGLSPLMMAIRGNQTTMAEFLLKKGADVNILDKCQRSPLMIAAGNGNMDMVQILLKFQADFTLKDNKGLSAEDFALANDYHHCAQLISEHAAKRNLAPYLATPLQCEEIIKSEPESPQEIPDCWDRPSTSIDDMFKSDNTSLESLPEGKAEFQAEEFPQAKIASVKEEMADVFSSAPLAPRMAIRPNAKTVSALPRPLPLDHYGANVLFQESDESDWDQDSSISFCNKIKTPRLQTAVQEGSSEMSMIESDEQGSFHSKMEQIKKKVSTETWDIKPEDEGEEEEEEEEEAGFNVVVRNVMIRNQPAQSYNVKEENQDESEEDSAGKEDIGSMRLVDQAKRLDSESEDSIGDSSEPSLKGKKFDDCHLAQKTRLQGKEEEEEEEEEEFIPSEAPPLHLTEMENRGKVVQNTSDESKIGASQSIKQEQPETPPETCEGTTEESSNDQTEEKVSRNIKSKTCVRPSEQSSIEQTESKYFCLNDLPSAPSQVHQFVPPRMLLESQLAQAPTFPIRPTATAAGGGHSEDSSQLTPVREAVGLRVPQNNSGIQDLFMLDSVLSDLLEYDGRYKSAEWLKRTRNTIQNIDGSEISEDTDGLLSEDSDIAHNIRGLDSASSDSRSEKHFQHKVDQQFLKAKFYLGPEGDRLRKLEVEKRNLEERNFELQSANASLRVQLKTANANINAYESTNNKLNEDHRKAQMMLVQNENALNLLLQNVNSQVVKQKEMEEEYKRSKNNEEQLRSELEELQASCNIKQRDLSEENETLKDKVEDLRQDLKILSDNESQDCLIRDKEFSLLKYELQLANAQLDNERRAGDRLEADFRSCRSRLVETEQTRLEMEKTLLLEKEENRRLASQDVLHLEAINKSSQKLTKLKAHANTLESDVHRFELQIAEKTALLSNVQRECDQSSARVKELETTLQAEKESLARVTSSQENTQGLLKQAQNEVTSLRQRLEEAQTKMVAKDYALTDAKNSFNDSMFKLRTECEERVQQAQSTCKDLTFKVNELNTLVSKLEKDNTEKQASQKQMQQQLDDSIKKLSKCEASLEITTRHRSDLEEEKTKLLQDVDNLKQKLSEKETQCIQAEKLINERVSHLDERERELSFATRRQKESQAAVDASDSASRQLEEDLQRLELDNIRLETAAKQHSSKFEALQRAAQEDARMRVQLEELVTNLQSKKLALEEQLNKEVQKHTALSNGAQDAQFMWEEELKGRSKLGLRLAELEKEKDAMSTQMETEKKKGEELEEQKKSMECRLEQEMKRNSELQKEMYRLQSLLKAAKKKMTEQQFSQGDKEKLNQQLNELQAELEKEQSFRNQLERSRKQLEDDLLSLRRTQVPTMDGGFMGMAPNPQGYQYRCLCTKSHSPVRESPTYSVQDYLTKVGGHQCFGGTMLRSTNAI